MALLFAKLSAFTTMGVLILDLAFILFPAPSIRLIRIHPDQHNLLNCVLLSGAIFMMGYVTWSKFLTPRTKYIAVALITLTNLHFALVVQTAALLLMTHLALVLGTFAMLAVSAVTGFGVDDEDDTTQRGKPQTRPKKDFKKDMQKIEAKKETKQNIKLKERSKKEAVVTAKKELLEEKKAKKEGDKDKEKSNDQGDGKAKASKSKKKKKE